MRCTRACMDMNRGPVWQWQLYYYIHTPRLSTPYILIFRDSDGIVALVSRPLSPRRSQLARRAPYTPADGRLESRVEAGALWRRNPPKRSSKEQPRLGAAEPNRWVLAASVLSCPDIRRQLALLVRYVFIASSHIARESRVRCTFSLVIRRAYITFLIQSASLERFDEKPQIYNTIMGDLSAARGPALRPVRQPAHFSAALLLRVMYSFIFI